MQAPTNIEEAVPAVDLAAVDLDAVDLDAVATITMCRERR